MVKTAPIYSFCWSTCTYTS